jgi:hypothetical protein
MELVDSRLQITTGSSHKEGRNKGIGFVLFMRSMLEEPLDSLRTTRPRDHATVSQHTVDDAGDSRIA